MNEREEAFEVAKLAAMVGGQMKKVDQMTVERTSNNANRINIQDYINKVKNPRASIPVRAPSPPPGFAAPVSEAMVQSMCPDVKPSYIPPNVQPEPLKEIPSSLPTATAITQDSSPQKELTSVTQQNNLNIFNRSDINSIKNSLKNIDKTLNNMLSLLKTSNE